MLFQRAPRHPLATMHASCLQARDQLFADPTPVRKWKRGFAALGAAAGIQPAPAIDAEAVAVVALMHFPFRKLKANRTQQRLRHAEARKGGSPLKLEP